MAFALGLLAWPGQGLGFLVERIDGLYLAVWLAWAASLFAVLGPGWSGALSQPTRGLLLSSPPLIVGTAAGLLAAGADEGAVQGELAQGCSFLLAFGYSAARIQLLGFVCTACLWIGQLTVWVPAARGEGEQPGRAIARTWRWAAGIAVWLAAAVWTLADPLLPSTGEVGGLGVLGLWPLVLGLPALLLAAEAWTREAERALAIGTACLAGLGLLGAAALFGLRIEALGELVFGAAPAPAAREGYGGALGTAWLSSAPLWALAWLGLLVKAALGRAAIRRRAAWLLACLSVVGILIASGELGFRDGFENRCQAVARCELPEGRILASVEQGPLLSLSAQSASLDARPLDEASPTFPLASGGLAALRIAADAGIVFDRLERLVSAASRRGWNLFGLLVRPPGADGRCQREQRALGICMSLRDENLGAILFRAGSAVQSRPPAAEAFVVANLLVGEQALELSFGGFGPGTDAAALDALGARLERKDGRDALDELEAALRKAKEAFPSSQRVTVAVEGRVELRRLAPILDRVQADRSPLHRPLFYVITLVRSVR